MKWARPVVPVTGDVPTPLLVGLGEIWGHDAPARQRWKAARAQWRVDQGLDGPTGWHALPDEGWWPTVAAGTPNPAASVDARLRRLGLTRDDLPRLAAEARAGWPGLFAPASASPWGSPLRG